MSRRPGRRASSVVTAASAMLVLLPVLAVAAGVLTADAVSWERVAGSGWPALTLSTLLLVGRGEPPRTREPPQEFAGPRLHVAPTGDQVVLDAGHRGG